MRVLHLSTTDIQGGAARGAFWLHRELQAQGADTAMLVGRKYGEDGSVVALEAAGGRMRRWLRAELDQLPLRLYRKTSESYWTVGWVPQRLNRMVERLAPDIVHLHWTGAGFLSVEDLRQFRRPIVWTLRDMWAFTGGCHYTAGCERYREGCGRCPQLRSTHDCDLSRWIWQNKKRNWQGLDLWLVPISQWLADCGRSSALFQDVPIEVIPNGVDAECFSPADKRAARSHWGLRNDRLIILYGAFRADDPRKGLGQLVEATQALARMGWADKAELVVFGDITRSDLPNAGLPASFVGAVRDDEKLARLYAAADVMAVPSLQEAFGKTLIEAMACGTPVVAFNSGGPSDIVEHEHTGYLAEPFDPEDFARGIAWCLKDEDRAAWLGAQSRARVRREFDISVVARRYTALYEKIMARAA